MIRKYNPNPRDKSCSFKTAEGFVHGAAVGDLENDNIQTCKVCKEAGFPHEAIKIQKIPGRVLSDGTNEIVDHKLIDYVTDRPHEHKDVFKDLGPILWSKVYGNNNSCREWGEGA